MKSMSFKKYGKATFQSQLWLFALSCLEQLGLLVVAIGFLLDIHQWRSLPEQQWAALAFILPGERGVMGYGFLSMVLSLLLGSLSGVVHFSYLHDPRQVDFVHSQPVKREKVFLARTLCLLINYLPAVAVSLVAPAAFALRGMLYKRLLAAFFITLVSCLVFYVLSYLSMALAMLLTGRVLIGVLGGAVFSFLCPVMSYMIRGAMRMCFHTLWTMDVPPEWNLTDVSPVFAAGHVLGRLPYREGFLALAVFALVCLLLLLLCLWVYKRRPSEAAGSAIAFPRFGKVLRVILTACAAFMAALLLASMARGWMTDALLLAGLLGGGLLVHAIIGFLYTLDIKRVLEGKKGLVVSLVLAGALMLTFQLDLIGFDSYLPGQEEMESVGVSLNFSSLYMFGDSEKRESLSSMEIPCTQEVYQLAVHCRDKALGIAYDEWRVDEEYFSAVFCYHLKNGRKVYRRYVLPISEMAGEAALLFDNPAYVDAIYARAEQGRKRIYAVNITGQEIPMLQEGQGKEAERAEELMNAIWEDAQNLSSKEVKEEVPLAALSFWFLEEEEETNPWRSYRWEDHLRHGMCLVYPSFTRTIRLLKEQGWDAKRGPEASEVEELWVDIYDEDGQYVSQEKLTEEKEIEALCPRLVWNRLYTIWQSYEKDRTVSVAYKGMGGVTDSCRILREE